MSRGLWTSFSIGKSRLSGHTVDSFDMTLEVCSATKFLVALSTSKVLVGVLAFAMPA